MKKIIKITTSIPFEAAKEKISKEAVQSHITNDGKREKRCVEIAFCSFICIGIAYFLVYLTKHLMFLFYPLTFCLIGELTALLILFRKPVYLQMKYYLMGGSLLYFLCSFSTIVFMEFMFREASLLRKVFLFSLFFLGIVLNVFISHTIIKWNLVGYTEELKPTRAEKIVKKVGMSLIVLGALFYLPYKELKATEPQVIRDLSDSPIGEFFIVTLGGTMGFSILATFSLVVGSNAIIEGYFIGKYAEEFRLAYGFSKEEFYGKKYRGKK